jgi:hypothetical protein
MGDIMVDVSAPLNKIRIHSLTVYNTVAVDVAGVFE